jgi:hypothetical protein
MIRGIKGIQNPYSKCSSHTLIGNVFENDIVKLVSDKKNAMVTKINTSSNWKKILSLGLKVLSYVVDKKGYYYFTGYFDEDIIIRSGRKMFECKLSQEGYPDVFVAKMKNGNIISLKLVPGILSDKAFDIKVDNHGDIYICGFYTDSITFDSIYLQNSDQLPHMFVAKINGKSWEWIWAVDCRGGSSMCYQLEIYNNSIYVCGRYDREIEFQTIPSQKYVNNNINNIFVAQINALDGDYNWIYNLERSNYVDRMEIKDMTIDNDMIYLLIQVDKDISISKIHTIDGEELDSKIFTNTEGKLIKINGEEMYICGNNFIMKLDVMMNKIWLTNFTGTCEGMIFDIQNNIYVVANFKKELSINNRKYNTDDERTCVIKMSSDSYVYDVDIFRTYIHHLQIHSQKGIYLAGYIDQEYLVMEYTPNDLNNKCLGIVRTPNYSQDGDIVDVDFGGYLSTGYKDLKAGYDYYIQMDGSIGITANDYYYGTALSFDKLLIKR